MKMNHYAQCLVACELSKEHFALGNTDEGVIAYNLVCQSLAEVKHPLHFLDGVLQCEYILQHYLWTGGDDV